MYLVYWYFLDDDNDKTSVSYAVDLERSSENPDDAGLFTAEQVKELKEKGCWTTRRGEDCNCQFGVYKKPLVIGQNYCVYSTLDLPTQG